MDGLQDFYDRLFEEPKTIQSCLNKTKWIRENIVDFPFKSSLFILSQRMIKETREKTFKLKTAYAMSNALTHFKR